MNPSIFKVWSYIGSLERNKSLMFAHESTDVLTSNLEESDLKENSKLRESYSNFSIS